MSDGKLNATDSGLEEVGLGVETVRRPLKRLKSAISIEELPEAPIGFHWEGNSSNIIANLQGHVVKVSRKIINCPGQEWFYQHFHMKTDKPDKVVCLFCLGEFNYVNSSNIIKHIKNAHQSDMEPFTHLSEIEIARIKREWDYTLLHSDKAPSLTTTTKKVSTESKSLMQIKIGDSVMRTVPIKKQQEILSEAIVKGLVIDLPYFLSFIYLIDH
jgi:hypothetical protein